MAISGCATAPFPQVLPDENGTENVFLAGDDNCLSYRYDTPTSILCYDRNGQFTEIRHRLTQEDIQNWQNEQERKKLMTNIAVGAIALAGIAALILSAGGGGYNPSNSNQGCCSWHGGIAGYYMGRIVCNDGNFSPSCTCP